MKSKEEQDYEQAEEDEAQMDFEDEQDDEIQVYYEKEEIEQADDKQKKDQFEDIQNLKSQYVTGIVTPRKNKFNIMDWIEKPKATPEVHKKKKARSSKGTGEDGIHSQHDADSVISETEEDKDKTKDKSDQVKKEEAERKEKERQRAIAAKEQALVGNEIEQMLLM